MVQRDLERQQTRAARSQSALENIRQAMVAVINASPPPLPPIATQLQTFFEDHQLVHTSVLRWFNTYFNSYGNDQYFANITGFFACALRGGQPLESL